MIFTFQQFKQTSMFWNQGSNKKIKIEIVKTPSGQNSEKVKLKATVPFCCIPCTLPLSVECRKCIYCKDKKKWGGDGKLRQKCVLRICEKKKNIKKK